MKLQPMKKFLILYKLSGVNIEQMQVFVIHFGKIHKYRMHTNGHGVCRTKIYQYNAIISFGMQTLTLMNVLETPLFKS